MKQEFDMFEIEYTESDLEYIDDLIKYFKNNYKNNDLLITMGAGNIDSVGVNLLSQ